MKRLILTLVLVAFALAPSAWAVNPGTELWVPGVARADGAQGTHWMTDLTLLNPTGETVAVTLQFFSRDLTTPPNSQSIDLASGETLQLEDVLQAVFGMQQAAGALRITADAGVAATSRIYNVAAEGATFGQGVDAVPTNGALLAGHSTTILGIAQGPTSRTNVVILEITGEGSTLELELVDGAGNAVASKTVELEAWEPMLESVAAVFGMNAAADSRINITTVTGSAVVMASRVDSATGDPATLTPLMPGRGAVAPAGVYWGTVVDSFIPGGIQMIVDADSAVTHLHLAFPSNKVGCGFTFPAGGDFTSGVPLTAFESADGVTWFQDYVIDELNSGRIHWTVKFNHVEANAYASGTVSGVGEGFTGACDGSLGSFNLHLSRPLTD